jgi:putative NADH-flavin reductase
MRMFRNYDGKNSTFGEIEVSATNSDTVDASVYVSVVHQPRPPDAGGDQQADDRRSPRWMLMYSSPQPLHCILERSAVCLQSLMNVIIIGAAGKTGSIVVDRAVAAGHTVTAFVRDAAAYTAPLPSVRVAAGDATDVARLGKEMTGQDAVIDTIGGKTPFFNTELERTVAKAVLAAMKQANVRRLIAVSALGVGDSKDQSGFFFEHLLLPVFLRGSTKDKEAMEDVVRHSDVQFVLVRPAVLNDQKPTGHIRVFTGHEKAHKITRADVAQFLVDQLQTDTYLGQAVTIANE